MHYDIYLEKDGHRVATCGSYEAIKIAFGYQVKVSHIYPEVTPDNALVNVNKLRDFRLVCETATRRIEYIFQGWGYDEEPVTEINGSISRMIGTARWRKEIANKT